MDFLAGATSLIQLIMTGCTEFPSLGLWVSNRILWGRGWGREKRRRAASSLALIPVCKTWKLKHTLKESSS